MTLEEGNALRERLWRAYSKVETWRRRGWGPEPSLYTLFCLSLITASDDLLDAMERKAERDKRILRSA